MSRVCRHLLSFGFFIASLSMIGCTGPGDLVMMDLHALPAVDAEAERSRAPLSVLVQPFEDRRPQREKLGMRTHLGGGATAFDVEDGKVGERITEIFADYLKERGWDVKVGSVDAPQHDPPADLVMSGQVLDLSARAQSGFGHTTMTASLKAAFQARNTKSGVTATMNVDHAREDSVFWFEPQDLENLVNQMLRESLTSVVKDIKVTDSSVQMR